MEKLSIIYKLRYKFFFLQESLLSFLYNCTKPFLFNFYQKEGVNKKKKRDKEIIISLSTIPSRINKIYLCIECLLRQSVKPDRIMLYLDKDKFYDYELPFLLHNQKSRGLEIIFCKDLGPHTKYFYSIQNFPNDIVITVDDDIFYSKHLVASLMKSYNKFPYAISCIRATKINFKSNIELCKYNDWFFYYNRLKKPSHQLLATGVGGVLYPPKCMNSLLFDKSLFLKLCPKADDIWLKMIQILSDTKVVAVPKRKHLIVIKGTESISLYKENVLNNANDICINNLLNEFNNYNSIENYILNRIYFE